MLPQAPSVGRIVHYTSYGTPGGEYTSQCRAAVVTAIDDGRGGVPEGGVPNVDLCVLNPEGFFFNRGVRFEDGSSACRAEAKLKGGTWHWPERI